MLVSWAAVRADAVTRFGQKLPRREDEAAIIEVFQELPELVMRSIDDVAQAYDAGKVRSPWAVLTSRMKGAVTDSDVVADTGMALDKLKTLARARIEQVLFHYDREQDVLEELFGAQAVMGPIRRRLNRDDPLLQEHFADEGLREWVLGLWREHRPRGEAIEQAHVAAMREWSRSKVGMRYHTHKTGADSYMKVSECPICSPTEVTA